MRPQSIKIEVHHPFSQAGDNFRGYIWIDSWIKVVAGCGEMRFQVAVGARKHMPMINEDRLQIACAVLPEDCLAIVGVPCARIKEPCEPKVYSIPDASQAGTGEDLE